NTREELARLVRDRDVDVDPQRREERGHLCAQGVETVAGQGRDEDGAADRWGGRLPVSSRLLDQVDLVERDQTWLVAGAELVEDGLDGLAVLGHVAVGGIHDL